MIMENKLKIGDVLYRENYGKITHKVKIVRLTATQAISDKDTRFKIGLSDWGTAKEVGYTNRFSSGIWRIENESLKEHLRRQNAIEKLKGFDWSQVSTDLLESVLALIK